MTKPFYAAILQFSAIDDMRSGKRASVNLTLRLTVPDLSGLRPEMDRIVGLIGSGALEPRYLQDRTANRLGPRETGDGLNDSPNLHDHSCDTPSTSAPGIQPAGLFQEGA